MESYKHLKKIRDVIIVWKKYSLNCYPSNDNLRVTLSAYTYHCLRNAR